jgi:hypothetical protein
MIRFDPASPDFEALSPDLQARVWYFEIGWDVPAIADELGISTKVVGRWLDSDGMHLRERPKRQRNRDYSEVYRLYECGKTPTEIIKTLCLPTGNVYRALQRKYGELRKGDAA